MRLLPAVDWDLPSILPAVPKFVAGLVPSRTFASAFGGSVTTLVVVEREMVALALWPPPVAVTVKGPPLEGAVKRPPLVTAPPEGDQVRSGFRVMTVPN